MKNKILIRKRSQSARSGHKEHFVVPFVFLRGLCDQYKFILSVLVLFFISFSASSQVTRQPYLQIPTPNSIIIRWQTGTGEVGKLYYGSSVSSLTESIKEPDDKRIYHEVELKLLKPDSKYY